MERPGRPMQAGQSSAKPAPADAGGASASLWTAIELAPKLILFCDRRL